MPATTINGITLNFAASSDVQRSYVRLGESTRSFNGALRKGRRAIEREWRGVTTPLTAAEALAWVGLLEGQGHVFSFDSSLYAATGLGPSATGTNTIGATAPVPKFGAARMAQTAGTTTWPANLGAAWTVMVWKHNGTVWEHHVRRSDGVFFLNGSTTGTAPTFLTVSSGSVSLGVGQFDDLVALPYLVPNAWLAIWGVATSAFSSLPALNVSGDLVNGLVVPCMGQVEGARAVYFNNALGESLDVSLSEI